MPNLTALPTPREWSSSHPLRWGVIAPGGIAEKFVHAIRRCTPHDVVAVGSRSVDRATAFAAAHGIPRPYGDYRSVAEDSAVDAVYVASPHNAHAEHALLAIAAGKHVLVEKPVATTAADARAIFDAARAAGVFAMEAMWTRYLPQSDIIRQLLADEAIGEIGAVAAGFGFSFPYTPDHRLYDPAQAGGALLDAGVYPVSFISSVLGPPGDLTASGSLAQSGVDDQASISLVYDRAVGHALTSLRSWLPISASISGAAGRIEVDQPFFQPSGLRVSVIADGSRPPRVLEWKDSGFETPYDALSCEAIAFAGFVEQGLVESPIHTHQEVVAIVDALDRAVLEIARESA